MSIVEHLGPAAAAWLRKGAAQTKSSSTPVAPLVSLASVEYELSQLRSSLDGFVDFKDRPSAPESTPVVAGNAGIERKFGIRARLAPAG